MPHERRTAIEFAHCFRDDLADDLLGGFHLFNEVDAFSSPDDARRKIIGVDGRDQLLRLLGKLTETK